MPQQDAFRQSCTLEICVLLGGWAEIVKILRARAGRLPVAQCQSPNIQTKQCPHQKRTLPSSWACRSFGRTHHTCLNQALADVIHLLQKEQQSPPSFFLGFALTFAFALGFTTFLRCSRYSRTTRAASHQLLSEVPFFCFLSGHGKTREVHFITITGESKGDP